MATLPAVPKVVRVDWHFSQASTANLEFRNFYEYTGALSLTDATVWLAAIQTSTVAHLLAQLHSSVILNFIQLTDLTSVSSPQVQNATGGAGTDGNPELNAGVAMIVKEHIVRRYRGGHPRVYIPGLTQDRLLTATKWTTSGLSNMLAAYVAMINDNLAGIPVAGGTATPVNVSYFHGFTVSEGPTGRPRIVPTPRPTPLIDVITNFTMNPVPASQRRRNSQHA